MTDKKFLLWVKALRLFSLPASVMPILLAAAYVFSLQHQHGLEADQVRWWLLPLIMAAGVSYHLGANLISDFHDWKNGVDQEDTYGSSRILVQGELPPASLLYAGYWLIGLGTLLGFIMLYFTGWMLLWFGLAGCLGGVFYTQIKYIALGEFLIFALFGLLMVAGTVLVLTGTLPAEVWLLALPLACLTTGILLANNTRDILHDKRVPIKTMPILLGLKFAKVEYCVLLGAAYITVALLVYARIVDYGSLLVFLTLPVAVKNIRYISRAKVMQPALIKDGDAMTARLQMIFSIIFISSIVVDAFLSVN